MNKQEDKKLEVISINAGMLRKMLIAGANQIENEKEYINELNVFPVPDGDTGSNMSMTIISAANALSELDDEGLTITSVVKTLSSGSLRGARGNSGVILSQLFRGFSKELTNDKEITTERVAVAFERAVETAYKAVMKPKEGTILTVAKAVAAEAKAICQKEKDFVSFGEKILAAGNTMLDKTPEMLPVLKEAGVVDSGGKGLMTILEGAYTRMLGKEVLKVFPKSTPTLSNTDQSNTSEAEITFGYCTEFIVNTEKEVTPEQAEGLKEYLSNIGDSLVCVYDGNIIKIHVHTNHPGKAFERGLKIGSLSNMKVDNMRIEHKEKLRKQAEKELQAQQKDKTEKKIVPPSKEMGFLAVCAGDGMAEIFKGLGVDEIVSGGQTMNPSTEDLVNAILTIPARNVFVLPNNKNIILAANQAASIVEDRKVIVLPTKTMPQGITSLIEFSLEGDVASNEKKMTDAISLVHSGEVTYAIRDTSVNDITIHKDDIMGIADGDICNVGDDINTVSENVIDKMMFEDAELISLYYGEGLAKEKAEELGSLLEEKYPDCDVEVTFGGQPVYYYILSVE